MKEKGMKKERNFPLLRPWPEELAKLKHQDPLFFGELRRFENFVQMVLHEKTRRKRISVIAQALRDIFGARGKNEAIYKNLNQALEDAKKVVRDLIQKVPPKVRSLLESEGEVDEEEDFISLLEKWKRFSGEEGKLSKLREYEARRLIVFSLIIFHLNLYSRRLHLNGASLQAVTSYLERKFFDRGVICYKTIFALHNPADKFRVGAWYFEEEFPENLKIEKGWRLEKYKLPCRQFSHKGKQYLVYFSCRQKTPYSHLLKMLRKDIRDPQSSALDWRGFKLVFFDEKALEAGLEKLREEVFYLPAVTWKLEDGRFFRETANIFSAKRFQAKKFVTTLAGEPVEIIVETLVNHLNGFASQGEENHELYRFRQLMKSAFPLVFPQEIYGINWEELEEELKSETLFW